MTKGGWVYIMANRYRGGMYVGVTSDLIRRVYQHRGGEGSKHVTDFGKTRLVYAERHEDITAAIVREKLVKNDWFPANGAQGWPSPVSSTG
jgi:putative endonuclease